MNIPYRYPCALTIAGSDSSGGAGIQADLKSFAARGVYAASVITAVTAQNTTGVSAIHTVPTEIIAAQLDAVFSDIEFSAVKIGMLASADIIRLVADRLQQFKIKKVVLDTVMVAKSGHALLPDEAVAALQQYLIPLATVITPNLPEAARLLQLTELPSAEETVRQLLMHGANAVLLKGGHGTDDILLDLLQEKGKPAQHFHHPRIASKNTHGTGCSLSSAIAAGLAHGLSLAQASEEAIDWLYQAILESWPLGHGQGPVHHFWQFWPSPKNDPTTKQREA